MKRLIICEGPNELCIMRILLNNDKLIFGEDELIGLTPYFARQLNNATVKNELDIYPGKDVVVMRVGDVQNENLKIPEDYSEKIIRFGKKKYDNSTQFFIDYYGSNPDSLVEAIRKYKRIKGSHKKDELYLADLMK